MIDIEYIRDDVMYVAVFSFFSFVWFGWAQENPPQKWRKYIGIASGFAFVLCATGVYLSITNWNKPSALSEQSSFTVYLIVFYTEFLIAALGVYFLFRKQKNNYIAPWIALVVGVHFCFLVNVFKDNSLYIVATLMIILACTTPHLSKRYSLTNSTIVGIGSGVILFSFAILGLIRFLVHL